jgi:hypothetical protein
MGTRMTLDNPQGSLEYYTAACPREEDMEGLLKQRGLRRGANEIAFLSRMITCTRPRMSSRQQRSQLDMDSYCRSVIQKEDTVNHHALQSLKRRVRGSALRPRKWRCKRSTPTILRCNLPDMGLNYTTEFGEKGWDRTLRHILETW